MAYIYKSVPFKDSKFVKAGPSSALSTEFPKRLASVLEPANGAEEDLNIIKKFNWTYTPINDTISKEIPYIKLREFYLLDSYWNQMFKAYGRQITNVTNLGPALLNPNILNGGLDLLYQGLYDHTNPTGFTYTFPYFSSDYLSTNNSWVAKPMFEELTNIQKQFAGIASAGATVGIGTIIGLIAGGALLFTGPGGWVVRGAMALAAFQTFKNTLKSSIDTAKIAKAYGERGFQYKKIVETAKTGMYSPVSMGMKDPAIDKPHIWSTTTPRSFTVTFPLYNTLTQPEINKTKWYNQILRNWELCHLLCYQNLYNKNNLFTGVPPVFYEIDIPGVHYSKAGYVSDLQIMNVGNIRKLNLPIGNNEQQEVNVPDAYLINMTVTDFFIPSKNFMSSLCDDNKGKLLEKYSLKTEAQGNELDYTAKLREEIKLRSEEPYAYPGAGLPYVLPPDLGNSPFTTN